MFKIWEERKVFGNSGVRRLAQATGVSLDDGDPVSGRSQGTPSPGKSPEGQSGPPSASVAVESVEEVRELKGLLAQADRSASEARRLERQHKESLSTSAIVSGSADLSVVQKYEKAMWAAVQAETKVVSFLDKWKGSLEASVSEKKERIKQVKKDKLARREVVEREGHAGHQAAGMVTQPPELGAPVAPTSSQQAAQAFLEQVAAMRPEELEQAGAKILKQVSQDQIRSALAGAAKRQKTSQGPRFM